MFFRSSSSRAHWALLPQSQHSLPVLRFFLMDDRQFGYLFSLPFFYPPSILLVASSHRRRRKRKELTSESLYLSSNHVSLWQPNKTFLHKMRCLKTHSERGHNIIYKTEIERNMRLKQKIQNVCVSDTGARLMRI